MVAENQIRQDSVQTGQSSNGDGDAPDPGSSEFNTAVEARAREIQSENNRLTNEATEALNKSNEAIKDLTARLEDAEKETEEMLDPATRQGLLNRRNQRTSERQTQQRVRDIETREDAVSKREQAANARDWDALTFRIATEYSTPEVTIDPKRLASYGLKDEASLKDIAVLLNPAAKPPEKPKVIAPGAGTSGDIFDRSRATSRQLIERGLAKQGYK